MLRKNQKGFGVVEVILIIVAVGLIGGTGYYVYRSQNETKDTLSNIPSAQNDPQKTDKKSVDKPATSQEKDIVAIKEWGVKVTFPNIDASLLEYTISNSGEEIEYVTFKLKTTAVSDQSCRDLGAGYERSKTESSFSTIVNNNPVTKIDAYFYRPSGAPGGCENEKDAKLRQSILGSKWTITKL